MTNEEVKYFLFKVHEHMETYEGSGKHKIVYEEKYIIELLNKLGLNIKYNK